MSGDKEQLISRLDELRKKKAEAVRSASMGGYLTGAVGCLLAGSAMLIMWPDPAEVFGVYLCLLGILLLLVAYRTRKNKLAKADACESEINALTRELKRQNVSAD